MKAEKAFDIVKATDKAIDLVKGGEKALDLTKTIEKGVTKPDFTAAPGGTVNPYDLLKDSGVPSTFDDLDREIFDSGNWTMKYEGSTKPEQVHHFASNKNEKYTQQFEQVTSKYKLDLDDTWNKELMPHQGRHPYAYHDYVLEQIKKFDMVAN